MSYSDKLYRILRIEHVRFVAVASMDGNVIASELKEGVEPLLTPSETRHSVTHGVNAWKARMRFTKKLGYGLYTVAVYQKVRRVTIPLKSGNLLFVTIDNYGGQQQTIDKILNEVIYRDYTKAIRSVH